MRTNSPANISPPGAGAFLDRVYGGADAFLHWVYGCVAPPYAGLSMVTYEGASIHPM